MTPIVCTIFNDIEFPDDISGNPTPNRPQTGCKVKWPISILLQPMVLIFFPSNVGTQNYPMN